MKNLIVLCALFVAVSALAGDSSWNYGNSKSVIMFNHPTQYYGLGTQCVMTTGFYGATATAQKGTLVHVVLFTRSGRNQVGKDTNTGALVNGLKLVETTCGDTILLLSQNEQKIVRPVLLAQQ